MLSSRGRNSGAERGPEGLKSTAPVEVCWKLKGEDICGRRILVVFPEWRRSSIQDLFFSFMRARALLSLCSLDMGLEDAARMGEVGLGWS